MVEIPEYKRDGSKDDEFILEGLNEMPFPIWEQVFIEFLMGTENDLFIEKNKLFEYSSFGILKFLERKEIEKTIENLIKKKLICVSSSVLNKSVEVLTISEEGKKELGKTKEIQIKKEYDEEDLKFFKHMKDFLENFSPEQGKAITSPSKEIICIAGAGSGKTTVLTKRIEFLAKMKKVKGDKILAITFTRKAKEEMEKRLLNLGVRAVVETFNSFSEKILLKYERKIYGKRVRIATFQDKMVAILKSLEELHTTINEAIEKYYNLDSKSPKNSYELQSAFVADCFNLFEYFRVSETTIDEFEKKYFGGVDENSKLMFKIVRSIDRYFRAFGLRTYADQTKDALNFFRVQPKFIPLFSHVLVDEFQDVNKIQSLLLETLKPENLFCVGDPRQSIFGWRGSELKYILDFQNKYPNSELINLNKNYRSSEKIINLINESLRNMNFPDLEHFKSSEGKINLFSFDSQEKEFDFVKNEILSFPFPREEIFVLARTNRELQEFSKVLDKAQIKYILKTENKSEVSIKKGEIILSTIHSIKGLEAQVVFILGCTPSNFPLRHSEHPIIEKTKFYPYDKNDEERRLFYVGLSRTKNILYLTYSGKKHTNFITEEMKKLFC
ncbi:MAG: UvrD-helicase domain-containing protein [Nanoarchaeota archaeon]|nr:UvrD-helicase domain-containing protein [Nanoarchaeota archaeon]